MTKLTAETINDDQIRTLRDEAEAAADYALASVCTYALGPTDPEFANLPETENPLRQPTARRLCAEAINNARAQED